MLDTKNITQRDPMVAKIKRQENLFKLRDEIKPSACKLLDAISLFMSYLNRVARAPKHIRELIDSKYYDKADREHSRRNNILVIDPEFVFHFGIIDPDNYTRKKDANLGARKLVKELVKHNVLTKIGKLKDQYMINPLYIYWGVERNCNFADCYSHWCERTKEQRNEKIYKEAWEPFKDNEDSFDLEFDLDDTIPPESEYGVAVSSIEEELNNELNRREDPHKRLVDSVIRQELPRYRGDKKLEAEHWRAAYIRNDIPLSELPPNVIEHLPVEDQTVPF